MTDSQEVDYSGTLPRPHNSTPTIIGRQPLKTGLISPRWQPRVLPLAIGLNVAFLVAYVLFAFAGLIPGLKPNELPGTPSSWCERVSDGMFREPANTLSNLGFVVVGLMMLYVLSRDRAADVGCNAFYGLTPIALLYASTSIWLGPGSLLMHGTHTKWGGWADNLSMVMYILVPWLVNVSYMGRWHTRRLLLTYTGIVVTYAVARWLFGGRLGIGLDVFGLSIALWFISEILYRFWSPGLRWASGLIGFGVAAAFGIMPWDMLAQPDRFWWVFLFWLPGLLATHPPPGRRTYTPWYFAGVMAYMTAFAIWLTGRPDNPWCDPDTVFQAHAIWHLLSALATWCFFQFLRTERSVPAKPVPAATEAGQSAGSDICGGG